MKKIIDFSLKRINYLKNNFIYIIFVVIVLIVLLSISSMLRKDNRTKNNPINVTITESFKNSCNIDKSLNEREEWCGKFRNNTCILNGCCVLLESEENESKCVAGSETGPLIAHDYNYYTYKKKCYDKLGKFIGKECSEE